MKKLLDQRLARSDSLDNGFAAAGDGDDSNDGDEKDDDETEVLLLSDPLLVRPLDSFLVRELHLPSWLLLTYLYDLLYHLLYGLPLGWF